MEVTDGGELLLGWTFGETSPVVRLSSRRVWKIRLGIEGLIERGGCTGRELESVIGHFTYAARVRPEALCAFQAAYSFASRSPLQWRRLWPAVRRELRWAIGPLPLMRRPLDAQWSEDVAITDASLWGRGVCVGRRRREDVATAGRYSDHWRFGKEAEAALRPREASVREEARLVAQWRRPGGARAGGPEPGDLGRWSGGADDAPRAPVPELGPELLAGGWTTASSGKLSRPEAAPALEGRALARAARRASRGLANRGARKLSITDAMSEVLALEIGRSSSPMLMRACRQWRATIFASQMPPGFDGPGQSSMSQTGPLDTTGQHGSRRAGLAPRAAGPRPLRGTPLQRGPRATPSAPGPELTRGALARPPERPCREAAPPSPTRSLLRRPAAAPGGHAARRAQRKPGRPRAAAATALAGGSAGATREARRASREARP